MLFNATRRSRFIVRTADVSAFRGFRTIPLHVLKSIFGTRWMLQYPNQIISPHYCAPTSFYP
jgi:hypothetical protein